VNARFWFYWIGSWVKLTVFPNVPLSLYTGGETEEGWNSYGVTFELDEDGLLTAAHWSDGRDCDGRLSTCDDFGVPLLALQRLGSARDNRNPDNSYAERTAPEWIRERSFQRDYFAEAMGY